MAMLMMLRDMHPNITVHGFRSSFRDLGRRGDGHTPRIGKRLAALEAGEHEIIQLLDEARAEAAEVLRLMPSYTITGTAKRIAQFKHAKDAEHLFDGLRKARLPE